MTWLQMVMKYKDVIAYVSLADLLIKTYRKWEDLSCLLCT